MLRRVALVRTDLSKEHIASIIWATRIACFGSSPSLVTQMMEEIFPLKRRFLQEPYGVTSPKTTFFIVTAVKISNLT
jgi:hypothetical protein